MVNNVKKAPQTKYKSVMDDPHYDPPDPYHRSFSSERPTRTQSGGMTVENREAMMKIFFWHCRPKPSCLK